MNTAQNKPSLRLRYLAIRPWGRHSLVLLVAGLVYMAIGTAYTLSVVSEERLVAIDAGISGFMTLDVWGTLFILVGMCAIISARWPPFAATWGYMALTGLSAAWSSVYGLSIIFYDSPSTNFTTVALWSLVSFMWWAISGLINPDRVVVLDGSG